MRTAILGLVGVVLVGAWPLDALSAPAASVPASARQSTTPAALLSLTDLQSQPSLQSQTSSIAPPTSAQRAVLDRYCVACHNHRLRTAGLVLDNNVDLERVSAAPEMWEKVVKKLRAGAMPPAGRPRPDRATYDALASWLETVLDRAAAANLNPGRPTVHRLNRVEYSNAIRDLLALELDGRSLLPADVSAYGFDNIAEALSFSPVQLERHLSAAVKISRLAVGDPAIQPAIETYSVPKHLAQDERIHEELPFGSRGGMVIRHYFPLDGEYVLRVRLQRTLGGQIRGLAEPNQLEVRLDGVRIALFAVGGKFRDQPGLRQEREYVRTADAGLEIRLRVDAGKRLIGVAFLKTTSAAPEGLGPAGWPLASYTYAGDRDSAMGVDSIQISGPYNGNTPESTPSRRSVFVCRPSGSHDEENCAKTILGRLARRAYRRPVTDEDLQPLLRLYATRRTEGRGFDAGIQRALEGILLNPKFLFRIERDPANIAPATAYRLSDLELASRLSFFLWSSIPDDELLDVAARGQLKDPALLEQQVRRMLGDSRATALVSNFAGQWLQLRTLRTVTPDPASFPDFDDNLREAFQRETELFIGSLLREDRSVLDLLRANYTFVNERLARHYEIPNIYGSHFRRVTFRDDQRGGVLGQGSVLTVTSYATRTSPVLRGKWLLENILNAPPPAPPPNVPDLKERGQDGKPASVRERLEQHRQNPICMSCHAQMDPLGFSLENFDATGRWRSSDAGISVDASGVLPDGTAFQGPAELRRVLLNRRDEIVTGVTEKLLTYALGRGVEYYDAPAVRKIVREAAPSDYRWSSLVLGIVKSTPFQMRRSLP